MLSPATRVESGDELLDPNVVFDVQSGSSFIDGVQTASSEENNLDEYQSWTNFYDSGDDGNCVVPVMEEGGPSCVAEPDDGDCRVPIMDEGRPSSPPTHEGNFLDTSWLEEGKEAPETDVGEEMCAAVSVEEDSLYTGRVFKDKADMQNCLSLYAIKRLFYFRQTRSDPERLIFVCVDPTCRWIVFGHVVSRNSKNFEVRTATLTHTCTIATRAKYSKLASAKVIGSVLERKYANGLRGPRAIDIPDIVLDELKVSVTYMKAWYARETVVRKTRGSDEGSYELLAVYMYLLKQGNPGPIYKLEYKLGEKENKQFKYLFFSLAASIAGVKHMRKVVLVDGTAIKAKFKGVLLAVSMQDANFQVFPIAFGIVDSENIAAWTWFFRHLSGILPDTEDLVIVSDRHRSIYAAVDEVYPQAFHGACAVHIERNVRHFSRKGLSNLVGKAARAFNVSDFTKWYTEIGVRSARCQAYLDAIPLEHWTQAYCQAKCYNIMSSNVAEALNAAIAKFVELPIVSMVESIVTMDCQ
ncbi:PREDICTED: uncharacterized protein LOC104728617 [Camelina sativa]|uniref:Uncharacterized protein LOC104728617 n=1 Tax=Camelina sativa TaxID=90675 RepID=A0ABM0UT31_CAMSA|nr:PREDICTED: uncharacterized protein LOC104728617 [Camelina sativa]